MSRPKNPTAGRATPCGAAPPAGASDRAGRRGAAAAVLAVVAATAVAYSNTLRSPFHFDDLPSIVENRSLRDLGNLWPPSGSRWLGRLSFALDYRLHGLDPLGYHLANLAIHAGNALLVLWLAALALRTPALRGARAGPLLRRHLPLAAALLFALHPLQTQAVTYVVQRFTSLATLFYLLSLALLVKGRLSLEEGGSGGRGAAVLYGLSVLCGAAAMETKEIAFTLPFVAAGCELLLFGAGRRLWLLAPLAATAALVPLQMAGGTESAGDLLGDVSRLAAETQTISRWDYLLTETRVVATYLRLLVLPVGQNLDHDVALSRSLLEPGVLLSLSLLSAVAALAAILLVRARRRGEAEGQLVFAGVAWLFATLSVESSFIPIRDVLFEHRMYLPGAGAAVALGTALLWAAGRAPLGMGPAARVALALAVTAGPLGAATFARNRVWRDERTLWSDVVAKSPRKARGHSTLGALLERQGRSDEAIRELEEAVRLEPSLAEAHNNLGAAYSTKGRLEGAMREYREAVRLDPASPSPHVNLGIAHRLAGRLEDAVLEYREAVRIAPQNATAHQGLGATYQAMGRLDDAMAEYREVVRLEPGEAEVHNALGSLHGASRRIDLAMAEYREAIRLAPGYAEAHSNLGAALAAAGRQDEAMREWREAIRLDPAYAAPHHNLGAALRSSGRFDEAIRELEEALRLDPRHRKARMSLAACYEVLGRLDDAARAYREAIRLDPGSADAHEGLGRILDGQGRPAEAIEERRRALGGSGRPPLARAGADR